MPFNGRKANEGDYMRSEEFVRLDSGQSLTRRIKYVEEDSKKRIDDQ